MSIEILEIMSNQKGRERWEGEEKGVQPQKRAA